MFQQVAGDGYFFALDISVDGNSHFFHKNTAYISVGQFCISGDILQGNLLEDIAPDIIADSFHLMGMGS